MDQQKETVKGFEHKPAAWRKYKQGVISYQQYIAEGTYERPANLSLAQLAQYPMDTPRSSDY